MKEKDTFLEFIEISLKQLMLHKQISIECEVDEIMLELHDKTAYYCDIFKQIVTERELTINYINQFETDLTQTLNYFTYRHHQNLAFIQLQNKANIKQTIEKQILPLEEQLKLLQFNLDFFKKLNFFNSNIVAIGANGSGKTTLSNDLKKYLPNTGVVISAQKVLIIPTFSGVSNFNNTNKKLQSSQVADKSLKVTFSTENNGNAYHILSQLGGEFQVLLDNLLAERSVIRNQFCDALQKGGKETSVPMTKLDKALKIWNSLIQHRIMECDDGINITLKSLTESNHYPAHQMSDGEKVALYLISHILQAPSSGFIIVDEPEMYLHKTILKKLWDHLEQERQDCIFIYLTHDLDFATSRTTAKKIWIKSFIHPDKWEIEDIPTDEIPETLLFELLGSRKNILFCEGVKGSIDERVYSILFPELTTMPVGSCFDVMNHTKAFNKLQNVNTKAYGLIDSDHHDTARLEKLKESDVYSFKVAEIENLFLDSDFLKTLAKQILIDESKVELIKSDVIKELDKLKEIQASNYVSTKVNYYFTDSDVSKGNALDQLENNYQYFLNRISIQDWYLQRINELKEMISDLNYDNVLISINNKGIKNIAAKHLNISDFTDRSIKLLQTNCEAQFSLNKYFPEVIKTAGNKIIAV